MSLANSGIVFSAGVNPAAPFYRLEIETDSLGSVYVTVAVEDVGGGDLGIVAADLLDAVETYLASLPNYNATLARVTVAPVATSA